MMTTDVYVQYVLQVGLLCILILAAVQDCRAWLKSGQRFGAMTVLRGEKSMTKLYALYGITTGMYFLLIQIAEAFKGNKAILLVVDFAVLTYLFFGNSWFRNRIVFRAAQAAEQD